MTVNEIKKRNRSLKQAGLEAKVSLCGLKADRNHGSVKCTVKTGIRAAFCDV